jgi:hypothetical protein
MADASNETTERPLVVPPSSGALAIEQSRAAQEVQAALIMAKKFPRDEFAAYERIMKACKRPSMAGEAIYKLPISGENKEGPSIRLAEVLANAWGNIEFGIEVISRSEKSSSCQAYCWDLETNARSRSKFEVEHWIETGKKGQPKVKKPITDPIEIGRLISNHGARHKRNCIIDIIPSDVVSDAMGACRRTLLDGNGEPLSDRVRKMVVAFTEVSVTQEMIEKKLGHGVDTCTKEELVDLQGIFNSLMNKQSVR